MLRILLPSLLAAALFAACQSTNGPNDPPGPSEPKRQAVERSGAPPSWLERGTFLDRSPRHEGYRLFTGFSTGQTDLVEAQESALLHARRTAADFICTHIRSEYTQLVQSNATSGHESFLEVINVETEATVDSLIEGAEQAARHHWIRYSDRTHDCHALIRVPLENLDPIRSLVRAFRRQGAGATDPGKTLRYMENILTLNLHDRHAQLVRVRCLEQLGRNAEALTACSTLKEWNEGPELDLNKVYGDARIPVPAGSPSTIDLDGIIFRLTPHWNDLAARLVAAAEKGANGNCFALRTNRALFHLSEQEESTEPLMVTLSCPDRRDRWCSFFWIDSEGLCQVNMDAPRPDALDGPLRLTYPLSNLPGEVLLVGFASRKREVVDFSETDTSFAENLISRKKIETDKNEAEILRMETLVRLIEKRSVEEDFLVSAVVRFTVKP